MEVLKYKLRTIRTTIPDVNSGGCGVMVLAIFRYLKKNGKLRGDEQFIYSYFSKSEQMEQNQKYLESNEGSPTSCAHAVLFYKGKYWDVRGDEAWSRGVEMKIKSEKFIVDSCNAVDEWNSAFDRENIPTIAKILGVSLEDIKTYE